jgi:phage-related protein
MVDKAKKMGSDFVDSVINFFNSLPEKIGYALGFVIGKLILFANDATTWVKTEVPKIIDNIVTFFQELPGKIWTWLVNVVTNIVTWGSDIKSRATSAVSELVSSVVSYMQQLPGKIYNAIIGAVTQLTTWGSQMVSKAKTAVKNVSSTIVNELKSVPSKVTTIGRNIVEGLWNGIKNATSWIRSKVGEFAKGILDGMKSALGIHSPSTLFRDEVGRYIAEGIGVGVTDNADSPIEALKALGNDMASQDFNLNGATINRKLTTTFTGGSVSNVLDNASLLTKLNDIYDRLGRIQMVTDTGALVGEMIDKIDSGLANRQLLSARGV